VLIVGRLHAAWRHQLGALCLGRARHGCRQVDFLVPNRLEYGYGLSPEIVELAVARGTDLLGTVDNGISRLSGVGGRLRPAGMKC
jgi:single-stranded-DNA-specific exonuclease